jgi:hypothetical protein
MPGLEHALGAIATLVHASHAHAAEWGAGVEMLCNAALELGCVLLAERAETARRITRGSTLPSDGTLALWSALLDLPEHSRLHRKRAVFELMQLILQACDPHASHPGARKHVEILTVHG